MAYDQSIIAAIKREAARVSDPSKRSRYLKAALQTGIVESGLRNLNYGDADSKGWRQERQSLYANPTNVKASVKRFFAEAAQHDRGQPSWELAADVQRPAAQYRGRYKDVAKEAAKLAGSRSTDASAGTVTSTTTPGQTVTSTVTTGGDVTVPTLPERAKPTITGPALPDYVKSPPPTIAMPDREARRASITEAIQALGKVPESTTESTVTTPSETTTSTSGGGSAPKSGKGGSKVLELIFNDGGKGFAIENGQTVDGPGFFGGKTWAGHANHVHVAAGRKTVDALGKVAEKMGLHVGENPSFGGVNAGHADKSFHYRDQAIDVSGDPKKMRKFAKYVADYNRTRKL